jgi:hypothetical protein
MPEVAALCVVRSIYFFFFCFLLLIFISRSKSNPQSKSKATLSAYPFLPSRVLSSTPRDLLHRFDFDTPSPTTPREVRRRGAQRAWPLAPWRPGSSTVRRRLRRSAHHRLRLRHCQRGEEDSGAGGRRPAWGGAGALGRWGRAGSGRTAAGGWRRWRTTAEERVNELQASAAPLRMKTAASRLPAMAQADGDGLVSRGM